MKCVYQLGIPMTSIIRNYLTSLNWSYQVIHYKIFGIPLSFSHYKCHLPSSSASSASSSSSSNSPSSSTSSSPVKVTNNSYCTTRDCQSTTESKQQNHCCLSMYTFLYCVLIIYWYTMYMCLIHPFLNLWLACSRAMRQMNKMFLCTLLFHKQY